MTKASLTDKQYTSSTPSDLILSVGIARTKEKGKEEQEGEAATRLRALEYAQMQATYRTPPRSQAGAWTSKSE